MRAVVLVGGFGTRLRPLTDDVPKPMLPVGHRPIIERVVANLVDAGVDDVTLALGFKPQPFIDAFPDGHLAGARMRYAVEPEPLDTAGAILFAARFAGIEDTFVVANGDVLTDLDVGELVDFHHDHDAEATLHLVAVGDPSAFGVVDLDAGGRVRRFVEKPPAGTAPSNLVNAGTYVLEPSVLDRIEPGVRVSVERVTFPSVVADGGCWAMATDDYWLDTGRPDQYLQANLDLIGGRRRVYAEEVEAGASVASSAVVDGSVVSAGTVVAEGACVVRSVLTPGAVVGADATVVDSVVMGVVGEAALVDHGVVGRHGVVAADGELRHARLPEPGA